MGYLKDMNIYLAGPIDNYDGIDWRTEHNKDLKDLGLNIYNPIVKPKWMSKLGRGNREEMIEAMSDTLHSGVSSKLSQASAHVRTMCLSMISHSDIIFTYLPRSFTVGTIEEIFKADEQYKPIIFIFDDEFLPSLYLADLVGRHQFFTNMGDAINFLKNINDDGEKAIDLSTYDRKARWLSFTWRAK